MFSLFRWTALAKDKIVAWSTIKDAYLITVDDSCNRLLWTNGLSVTTAQARKVSKNFDFVVFDHERCKIQEIRPIDLTAMRKDEKERSAQPAKQAVAKF